MRTACFSQHHEAQQHRRADPTPSGSPLQHAAAMAQVEAWAALCLHPGGHSRMMSVLMPRAILLNSMSTF